ncbi:helix-turn-helix domain-containing protein [Paracoccus sp. DMF-8]|uniref:helix-turn-helix domain-containing protein n=1 Tax=Paracoccus sp. DMF-8 TaxID=3019445 RepID=UPI0023E86B7A|nr:helix-turn-helix domain-containing protein [Paracoccus sp. DMF-8]MDF3604850.1 helix-turn-helix domain-containing protein [Paracoccus sp. DMF-8]
MRAPALSPATPPPAHGLKPERAGGSQAVGRALSLLSLVGRGGDAGLGLAELAQAAGVTRSTARRLLLALGAARLVEQDIATRRYHLGPETYLLGTFAAERHGILTHARDSMNRLAAETGDTVLLTVPQDDHTLCLERIEGACTTSTHPCAGARRPQADGHGRRRAGHSGRPARGRIRRSAPPHRCPWSRRSDARPDP